MGIFDKLFQKNGGAKERDSAVRSARTDEKLRAMISGGSAADCGGDSFGGNAGGCSGCAGCGGSCDPASCGQAAGGEQKEEGASTVGWDAITATFEKFYPGQTAPLHFAPEVLWSRGGLDPLDNINVYDGKDYFHFVTYGLSELYDKESDNAAYSGYGFEFTVKLKKKGLGTTPQEINGELRNMADILQSLAHQTFQEERMFTPDQCIYTGQKKGIDREGRSNIVGFITRLDDAGVVETPNGWVKFTELIGVTAAELQGIENGWITVAQMYEALGSDCTDYDRVSMM